MFDTPLHVSDAAFEKTVLNSTTPVIVDFWAPWCGPCKMVDPIVTQLAGEWAGRVKVVKCNADENPQVIVDCGVLGLPTVMLFKDGKMIERVSGYQPKDKLAGKMSPHLSL